MCSAEEEEVNIILFQTYHYLDGSVERTNVPLLCSAEEE